VEAQHTKHVTYKLAYHLVWCPKYRKRILTGKIATFVEQEIRRICQANTWTIGALNVQKDHVHLFLSAPPSVAPSQIAHTLKGTTARKLFQRFPEIKKQLWGGALWSRSYYVGSVGDMSVDAVLKYIELGQDEERNARKTFYWSFSSVPLRRGPANLSTSDCL
jgi:putative transposase